MRGAGLRERRGRDGDPQVVIAARGRSSQPRRAGDTELSFSSVC